jgi:hypothetical protein
MDKETAQLIAGSAHHAAQAIARARFDLPVPLQEELYNRIYLALLEDCVGESNFAALLSALGRP